MSYRFGKLWHLAIIWAIRKAFQCIPQGVRFLLANHTRLSPTSENESYWESDLLIWLICPLLSPDLSLWKTCLSILIKEGPLFWLIWFKITPTLSLTSTILAKLGAFVYWRQVDSYWINGWDYGTALRWCRGKRHLDNTNRAGASR